MFCTYGVFVMLWGSTVAWSKGYSLHVVGLLLLNSAQIVPTPPAPRNGGPFQLFFGQAGQVDSLVGWRCCY